MYSVLSIKCVQQDYQALFIGIFIHGFFFYVRKTFEAEKQVNCEGFLDNNSIADWNGDFKISPQISNLNVLRKKSGVVWFSELCRLHVQRIDILHMYDFYGSTCVENSDFLILPNVTFSFSMSFLVWIRIKVHYDILIR